MKVDVGDDVDGKVPRATFAEFSALTILKKTLFTRRKYKQYECQWHL